MDFQDSARWHVRREELFAKRDGSRLVLDSLTISNIAEALPAMDFDAAIEALQTYRAAKPYKGFWWQTYLQHYGTAKTDIAPKRDAASPPTEMSALLDAKARQEQADEVAQYHAVPAHFRTQARLTYADWGIRRHDDDRAWRVLVIDAWEGRCVDQYKIHQRKDLERPREAKNPYTIIEKLRLELEEARELAGLPRWIPHAEQPSEG